MGDLATLQGLLNASDAMITRAGMRIPGFVQPLPFQYDLRVLEDNQARLQSALDAARQQQGNVNLGFPVLIATGAVLGISAVGGWIYKHFTDAKKVERQTEMYQDLREEGTPSERAAELVFGAGTDWGKMTKNLVLLAAIGAGLYLFIKLR